MSDQLPADLKQLEQSLRDLAPATPLLARDELMFRAGQATHARGGWRWPTLVAVLTLSTTALGVAHLWRPTPEVVEKIVYVTIKELAPAPPEPPPQAPTLPVPEPAHVNFEPSWPGHGAPYLHLRQQVLRWGADEMPPAASSSSAQPALRPGDLWRGEGFRLD